MRGTLAGFVLLAFLAAGCAAPRSPAGDAAWTLVDTEGRAWNRTDLEGRPALLFFMATWCPTCQAKAPDVVALHGAYGHRVQFLSVGFDPTETDGDLEAWKEARGQPWPHGVDTGQRVARTYGVTLQSWVVVLDPGGGVVLNAYNPSRGSIQGALDEALGA